MTRVLVVGATVDSEQTLLERLQDMAGLPQGTLSACRDPGLCDVLIVRDSPGLRSAALRMRQGRPEMQLWVEDSQGMLRDGGDMALPLLRRDDIVSVLAGEGQAQQGKVIQLPMTDLARARMEAVRHQQQEAARDHRIPPHPESPATAVVSAAGVEEPRARPSESLEQAVPAVPVQGATDVTRRLRMGIRQKAGYCLLRARGNALVVFDFAGGQAIVPDVGAVSGLAETAQWLGTHLQDVGVEEIGPAQFQAFESRGHRMPLRALLWQCALQFGHWQPLDAKLAAGATIHLQGWPDFRVLARQQDVFRLCSLLVKRPCTLTECMTLLDLPRPVVESFVHSAFLSGYARLEGNGAGASPAMPVTHAPADAAASAGTAGKVGGLLARMWRSVRGSGRGH